MHHSSTMFNSPTTPQLTTYGSAAHNVTCKSAPTTTATTIATLTPEQQLAEKYGRKYNLISFFLLRKNDEFYMSDEQVYMHEQYMYERVEFYVEALDLASLMSLFATRVSLSSSSSCSSMRSSSDEVSCCAREGEGREQKHGCVRLSDYVNSYNCSLFVFTIRKLLEKWGAFRSSALNSEKSCKPIKRALARCIKFMFGEEIRPSSYFLIDGDYPRRNVMHYAARYDCKLVAALIRDSLINAQQPEGDGDDENIDESNRRRGAEFVMAHLCMQPDFNGNTVVHLAAQNDSVSVLRQINAVCIRNSLYIYNDEGLNTFLIACQYATASFIRTFVEECLGSDALLAGKLLRDSRDQANIKNCFHYACARGCGNSCLRLVSYLTRLAASIKCDLTTTVFTF